MHNEAQRDRRAGQENQKKNDVGPNDRGDAAHERPEDGYEPDCPNRPGQRGDTGRVLKPAEHDVAQDQLQYDGRQKHTSRLSEQAADVEQDCHHLACRLA